jgi:putative NADPH-quinone reductase
MPAKRILLIQGHPDAHTRHLCHALEDAYAAGAEAAGHTVRRVNVARLDFPMLRSQADWESGQVPAGLASVQADIVWAQHLVLLFPLWLGGIPAYFKGFLEQVARPGFAFKAKDGNPFGRKGLTGRSARVVVTMGMPTIVYRWYFRASGVKSLERNILSFVGIDPVRETLIGGVDRLGDEGVADWKARLDRLGAEAE